METFDPVDAQQQEAQQKEQEAAAALDREKAIADFKWLMADPRGRRIVWRQLADSGMFISSFDPTAMRMAFNEGKRNEGIKLLAKVHEHCPDLYSTMMKEQQK